MARNSTARVVSNDFAKAVNNVRHAVGAEVRRIALELLEESKSETPFLDGDLRASGTAHWNGRRIAGGGPGVGKRRGVSGVNGGHGTGETTAAVAFHAVHARMQHERTDFAHPRGGKAKYLEDPLERNRAEYDRRIKEAGGDGLTTATWREL